MRPPAVERRIGQLFAVFLALLLIAGGRALWLGGIKGGSLAQAADTQQVDTEDVPAQRGTVRDRHGVELAVSEPTDDLSATPYLIKDPSKAAKELAALLPDTAEDELLRKLTRKSGFVYLARKIPGRISDKVRKLKIEGLQFSPTSRREYPREWLASQILGVVGTDGEGRTGLEYMHDDVLRGQDGKRRMVKDALGEPISVQDLKRSRAGKDIDLTIDAGLQAKTEEVLAEVGAKWRPKGATAMAMDPHTGEILALANWPRVDANDLGGAPPYAAQDRAVSFTYEPGSTFKAFTVAGALQDKKVTPGQMFNLPPTIKVADREIGESHPRGTVDLSATDILAQSSNVGTIKIGQRLGADRFDYWVRRFGFGDKTGVALPGEERGLVLARKKYSGSSMGNLPIGQGEAVTPIQLASAYSAIANGGVLRTPRIVKKVDGQAPENAPGRRIISRKVSSQVRHMLEGVLAPGGTASQAAIPGYTLAGKTGTANKVDEKTGEYSESRYIGSFVGFAPARKPKLLVTVMVDEPQGAIYGAQVAAPAFQEITRFALPYLGIAPE